MPQTTINPDICKGCGLCESVCPRNVIAHDPEILNQKGYNPAIVKNPDNCIGCAMCYTICPDCAITVIKE